MTGKMDLFKFPWRKRFRKDIQGPNYVSRIIIRTHVPMTRNKVHCS